MEATFSKEEDLKNVQGDKQRINEGYDYEDRALNGTYIGIHYNILEMTKLLNVYTRHTKKKNSSNRKKTSIKHIL